MPFEHAPFFPNIEYINFVLFFTLDEACLILIWTIMPSSLASRFDGGAQEVHLSPLIIHVQIINC